MEKWEQQYMGFGEEDPVLWLFVCGRKKLSFKSYTCVIGFKLGGLCEYADYDYLIKLLIGDNSKPRWHLLTTGWSIFVSQKNLVSGDADDYFQHHILGEVTSLLGFQILQKPKATSSIDHDLRDDVQVPRHSMKEKKVSIHINLRTRGQDREGFGRGATNFHIKRTNAKEAEIRDTPKNLQKYGKSTVFGMHGQFYVSFRNCKLGVEDMQGL
ncbi:hypothetical protein JHK84_050875 [Glycine max]|nr:hypothetical protein JHK84_050875 [Glycine max]